MGYNKIPHSIIKGKGFYNIDLGDNLIGIGGEVLLLNRNGALIGLNNLPYFLFATPDFSLDKIPSEGINRLPKDIKQTLYEVQEVILQSSFENYLFAEKEQPPAYKEIPTWIKDFKKLKSITFDYINIDNLHYLNELPIEKITLKNIQFTNESYLLTTIKKLKFLKTINYYKSTSDEKIKILDSLSLEINELNDQDIL